MRSRRSFRAGKRVRFSAERGLWPQDQSGSCAQVQTRIGLCETCRQAFLGHGHGQQRCRANGPEFPSSAWVSQLPHCGLARDSGVEGWPTGLALRKSLLLGFLPLDIHPRAVERGLRTERGLARKRSRLPSVGRVQWVRLKLQE